MTEPGQTRVVALTGGTGAIGKAIALGIAREAGHELVLMARNATKAKETVQEVIQRTGNPNIRYELVDVSRHASILDLANRWQGPLHGLVNNAAVSPRSREETAEGIEMQFATNVLGYFWLTRAFAEVLRESAPARVVDVASYWAGDLDLTDLEFKRRRYRNGTAYRQSKQANRMLAVAASQQFSPGEVTVNACHPGDVNSQLSNDLGFGGYETPAQAARTPIWLATGEVGGQVTGRYFEHQQAVRCRFGEDSAAVVTLYNACVDY
jgi:NAD(P)-dependent dehydrogenase (short-subunit alcohol dehydrogenase family)